MKLYAPLVVIVLLVTSCSGGSDQEKIENLNGYWEIKRVEKESQQPREYSFNQVVDYIEVKNNEGVRRKVRPQFDGTFLAGEDEEEFLVKVEGDSINLYYKTPFSTWKETLVSSKEDEIEIENQYGIRYTYKRFDPYLSDYDQKEE